MINCQLEAAASGSRLAAKFAAWLLVFTFSIGGAGCKPTVAPQSDVQQATELLNATLEHWKAGQTLDAQREKSPPVYVADELWLSGAKLTDFNIQQPGELFGTNVRLHVTLRVQDKSGKAQERQVKYLVTTAPALTIAREDR